MRNFRLSMWNTRVAIALVAMLIGTLIGAGSFALADGSDTVYYACVNSSSGTIHVVGTGDTCKNNEILISWNQQGPQGATGLTGEAGPQGAVGPQGTRRCHRCSGGNWCTGT